MSNFTQQMVALTMATLRADGKTDSTELEKIKQVATDLECHVEEADIFIREENEKQSQSSDIYVYIANVAGTVKAQEDKHLIMEACVQVALADKKLTTKEVDVLLTVCKAFGGNPAKMICDIAIFVQNDRDIKIEGSDSDFTEEFLDEN